MWGICVAIGNQKCLCCEMSRLRLDNTMAAGASTRFVLAQIDFNECEIISPFIGSLLHKTVFAG